MPPEHSASSINTAIVKATGELRPLLGEPSPARAGPIPARRDFTARLAELTVLFAAIVGAIALGLGISAYFGSHPYVVAYLIAYAVFRFADLLVRDRTALGMDSVCFARRMIHELPLLMLFFGAPFERTFVYGGEAPRWLAALGLLIELAGIWLALGARIQRGFYSPASDGDGARALIQTGLYRYIRHPVYTGGLVAIIAWPFEYGAPVTLLFATVFGFMVIKRRIYLEEADMMAEHGDAYASYVRVTDRMIPNLW
jgi:protein-S-isoprenylcysteine O-methyltransferase Ste14